MSSRLFQEIREKQGLVYSVYSFSAQYQDTGQFTVYAGTRPSNAAQVVGLIQEEFDRVRDEGLESAEIERAKESIKGHLVLSLENTRNRMTRLGRNAVTAGELLSIDEIVARVEAVDPQSVRRVAADVLSRDRVLAMIGPFSTSEVEHLIT